MTEPKKIVVSERQLKKMIREGFFALLGYKTKKPVKLQETVSYPSLKELYLDSEDK